MICCNCDFDRAKLKCKVCSENNEFCIKCSDLHINLKPFKSHTFETIEIKKVSPKMCINCESEESRFQCKDCPVTDSYYCQCCSVIHTKIKASKFHQLISLAPDNDILIQRGPGLVAAWTSMVSDIISKLRVNASVFSSDDSRDVYIVYGVLSLVVLALLRLFFGRNVGVVAVVVTIIGFRWYQTAIHKAGVRSDAEIPRVGASVQRAPLTPSRLLKVDTFHKDDPILHEGEFADEFWYASNKGRPATLRPRTRPYKRRQVSPKSASPGPLTHSLEAVD